MVVDVSFPEIEKFDLLPEPSVKGPAAFVSIMEGCSKYCTFCVVPYTRGEEVSRPVDDVIAEIASLADRGVKEVNLLGQNANAYRGHNHLSEVVDFADLFVDFAVIFANEIFAEIFAAEIFAEIFACLICFRMADLFPHG